jgi:hypothetical protein
LISYFRPLARLGWQLGVGDQVSISALHIQYTITYVYLQNCIICEIVIQFQFIAIAIDNNILAAVFHLEIGIRNLGYSLNFLRYLK